MEAAIAADAVARSEEAIDVRRSPPGPRSPTAAVRRSSPSPTAAMGSWRDTWNIRQKANLGKPVWASTPVRCFRRRIGCAEGARGCGCWRRQHGANDSKDQFLWLARPPACVGTWPATLSWLGS